MTELDLRSGDYPVSGVAVVTGSRDWEKSEHVWVKLDEFLPAIVVHGAARGVDKFADEWAEFHRVPQLRMPANWGRHGNSAGPRRNIQMLKRSVEIAYGSHEIPYVLAFQRAGSKGTEHCMKTAASLGLKVHLFLPGDFE